MFSSISAIIKIYQRLGGTHKNLFGSKKENLQLETSIPLFDVRFQVFFLFLIFQVLVEHIQPKDPANGLQYQKSLIGAVLNISCLLKTPGVVEGHGYFLNPSRSSAQETKVQEANIHQVIPSFFFLLTLLDSLATSYQFPNQRFCSSNISLVRVAVYGSVPWQAAPDLQKPATAFGWDPPLAAHVVGQLSAGQCRPSQDLGQSDARDILSNVRLGCIFPEPGCRSA